MKRPGFTLLELLAIVAIIAILGTIALTRYASSVNKAKDAQCAATRYIVTDAEKRFRIEHDGIASTSMEELRDARYIQALPVCKAGGTFAWVMNADNKGRHLACSLHGDALPSTPPTIPGNPAAPVNPPAAANPPAAVNPPAPANPPKTPGDCPPGTDYIRTIDYAKKTMVFVCAPKCPAGQIHHPATGVCQTPVMPKGPIHYCPPGWHWSTKFDKCTPNDLNSPKPKVCTGGKTWKEATGECK